MRKKVPVGYEDLKEIIEQEMYYVDKTLMIKQFINEHSKVNLFTRPRRFGKTLTLSMFRRFFEHEPDENGNQIDNSRLFHELKITGCGEHYQV